jgi:hypothetical protein
MDDSITPREERLAELLRREAEAERPAFSEELHQRIVEAVASRAVPGQPRGEWRSPPRARLAAAVAAGLLVAAMLLVALWAGRDPTGAVPPQGAAMGPSGGEAATEPDALDPPGPDPLEMVAASPAATLGTQFDLTLAKSQWAYLDHDARFAAGLVLDQLPLDLGLSGEDEIEH